MVCEMDSLEQFSEEAVSFVRTKLGKMEMRQRPNAPHWNPLSVIVEYSDPIAFAMEAWAEACPRGIVPSKYRLWVEPKQPG